ncbi:uncharacterized protein [Venturia canescens]|uniref:uncharacterized protein n=1 Tax=Venturia canescens TaxID=32260 RepID=UPI001C9BC7F8|nr:uncharacterized protein LOC122417769 [Venturia canescens]
MAKALGLQKKECSIPVGALNELTTISEGTVTATIQSRVNNYERTLTFLTIPAISNLVPDQPVNRGEIKIPKNLKLADPEFYRPAPVDMLISAGTALSLLSVGQLILSSPDGPELYLQKTQLGWVIGGSAPSKQSSRTSNCFVTSELHFDLNKFWELEEIQHNDRQSEQEILCEEHFKRNVCRSFDGRYSVALPFNDKKPKLGESKSTALKRLYSMERKLSRDREFKELYENVMKEYIDLGHMSLVSELEELRPGFYLPHHAVIKSSSLTTALRIVFDGSAKSSTGISLNEALFVGPTIQSELFTLLLRFRKYAYVITGDIEKMYRQFLVKPEDRSYQRILWRDENDEIRTYQLNTLTFGLSSAPYLAIRCLHQLAQDEGKDFPQAAKILQEDMYVDDALTGADTIEEAIAIRDQLTELLERGQLKIRQWASNSTRILEGLLPESINKHLLLNDSPTIKTLGLQWNSSTDSISYKVKPLTSPAIVTKRAVLSEIAKIFDPLGLLAPVITQAKILMQQLWRLKLDWDESLPEELHTTWINYHQQLQALNEFGFDRKVTIDDPVNIELHGFCDASEKAYGACIYVRSLNRAGESHSALLCSKSRVAPSSGILFIGDFKRRRVEKLQIRKENQWLEDANIFDVYCIRWLMEGRMGTIHPEEDWNHPAWMDPRGIYAAYDPD